MLGEKWDNPKVWDASHLPRASTSASDRRPGRCCSFWNARRTCVAGSFPVKNLKATCAAREPLRARKNTVASIREAARIGVDFCRGSRHPHYARRETTSLLHDGSLNRTTTGKKGPSGQVTFEEATNLSAGTWFGKPFPRNLGALLRGRASCSRRQARHVPRLQRHRPRTAHRRHSPPSHRRPARGLSVGELLRQHPQTRPAGPERFPCRSSGSINSTWSLPSSPMASMPRGRSFPRK